MAEKTQKMKLLTDNRLARFRYEILETYEAGIELRGTEVKSIIAGSANLQDAYALVRGGEVWLFNAHISPFQQASQYYNHEPRRDRKLLLHRKEINKLVGKIEQKGLTLVPLKMYMSNNKVKVALGLARGKKLHDKREDVKRRDDQRDMRRALKQY
jgi:SsrA-binding protein